MHAILLIKEKKKPLCPAWIIIIRWLSPRYWWEALKWLVMVHVKDNIYINVDSHQYTYRKNRSTSDAISSFIHTTLDSRDSYSRLLFLDFSSAFCDWRRDQSNQGQPCLTPNCKLIRAAVPTSAQKTHTTDGELQRQQWSLVSRPQVGVGQENRPQALGM